MFKAKHVHILKRNSHLNGKWVFGYLSGNSYISDLMSEIEYIIDKDTICQNTGLRDKNGCPIYEHDILSGHLDPEYPDDETREVVRWKMSGFVTYQIPMLKEVSDPSPLDQYTCENFEVVGNELDN